MSISQEKGHVSTEKASVSTEKASVSAEKASRVSAEKATRVTMTTTSLIDHIVTNTPEKISDSSVIHTGISDHSLVFAIRKILS